MGNSCGRAGSPPRREFCEYEYDSAEAEIIYVREGVYPPGFDQQGNRLRPRNTASQQPTTDVNLRARRAAGGAADSRSRPSPGSRSTQRPAAGANTTQSGSYRNNGDLSRVELLMLGFDPGPPPVENQERPPSRTARPQPSTGTNHRSNAAEGAEPRRQVEEYRNNATDPGNTANASASWNSLDCLIKSKIAQKLLRMDGGASPSLREFREVDKECRTLGLESVRALSASEPEKLRDLLSLFQGNALKKVILKGYIEDSHENTRSYYKRGQFKIKDLYSLPASVRELSLLYCQKINAEQLVGFIKTRANSENEKIAKLTLETDRIDDDFIKIIAPMHEYLPELSLKVKEYKKTEVVNWLATLKMLKALEVADSFFDAYCLSLPDSLEALSITKEKNSPFGKITNVGLSGLMNLTRLQHLKLKGVELDEEGIRLISAAEKIRSISIDGTNLTDSHWKLLKNGGNPRDIYAHFKVESLDDLKHKSRKCEINGVKIAGLSFQGNQFTNAHLSYLPASLEELHVDGSAEKINAKYLQTLKKIQGLKSIVLNDFKIDNAAFKVLADHPGIESMTIKSSSMDCRKLKDFYEKREQFKYLDIRGFVPDKWILFFSSHDKSTINGFSVFQKNHGGYVPVFPVE